MTEAREPGAVAPPAFSSPTEELAIRDALADAVERHSLRAVAREVHMSPTGLYGLLKGAAPYGKTKDKLRLWYAVHCERGTEPAELAPETVMGVFRTLLRGMPEWYRYAANVRVLNAFQEGFRRADTPAPEWIEAARGLNELRRPGQ